MAIAHTIPNCPRDALLKRLLERYKKQVLTYLDAKERIGRTRTKCSHDLYENTFKGLGKLETLFKISRIEW